MRTFFAASLFALAVACTRAAPAPAPAPASSPPAAAAATTPARKLVPITAASATTATRFLEAERLRFDARTAEADAALAAILAAEPDFPRALIRAAHRLGGAERTAMLERARARAATLPALEARWINAQLALADGQGDQAYAEIMAVADLAPDDWDVQMIAAEMTQFHHGKPVEARRLLERAIAADPTLASPYNLLAYGYSAEGDLERAVTAITRYAALAPGQANPLDSKGEILLEAGKLDEAEAAFRAALAIDPAFRAEDGIAAVQLHRGDVAAAITSFERAMKTQAKHPGMRWELGNALQWTYLIAERHDAALALVPELTTAAAASGHQHPEVYGELVRARVALHRKQWREALTVLDRAAALSEKTQDAHGVMQRRTIELQRLRAHLGAGDLTKAEAVRTALVAAKNDDDPARLATLLMAHAKGDLAAAKPVATELFAHRQHGAESRLLVADLAAAAGHADKATKLRTQVANTFGRDPRSYLMRKRAEKSLAAR